MLRKLFDYYPQARPIAFLREWHSEERSDSPWTEVTPVYTPRQGWRVLVNGRDVSYAGGFDLPICPGDEVAIFPPGR